MRIWCYIRKTLRVYVKEVKKSTLKKFKPNWGGSYVVKEVLPGKAISRKNESLPDCETVT